MSDLGNVSTTMQGASDIIFDMECWNESPNNTDDNVYRILTDDGMAVDLYYHSSIAVRMEVGRVYPNGGHNGISVSLDAMKYKDNGQFLTFYDGICQRVEVDAEHVISTGYIPWDMSLFSGNPRTIY